jgi:hypothetical protein
MSKTSLRFWVRWSSIYPLDTFEYHGPWWVTGWDSGDLPVVCAAVCAESAAHAQRVIASSYDIDHEVEFSFTELKPDDWKPFSSRFQKQDWMKWPMPCGSTGRADREVVR